MPGWPLPTFSTASAASDADGVDRSLVELGPLEGLRARGRTAFTESSFSRAVDARPARRADGPESRAACLRQAAGCRPPLVRSRNQPYTRDPGTRAGLSTVCKVTSQIGTISQCPARTSCATPRSSTYDGPRRGGNRADQVPCIDCRGLPNGTATRVSNEPHDEPGQPARPPRRRVPSSPPPTRRRSVPGGSVPSRAGAYVALTKPRIIELLLVTTVPTMILAAAAACPAFGLVLATLVGGAAAAGSANAAELLPRPRHRRGHEPHQAAPAGDGRDHAAAGPGVRPRARACCR